MPAIVIRVHGTVNCLTVRISHVLTLAGLESERGKAFCNVFLFSPLGEDDGELKLVFTSTMEEPFYY